MIGVKRYKPEEIISKLRVPHKQPKRGRLWLNDGSCVRLRPEYPNHVWAYDFVQDRTRDGCKFRMLTVIDEFTRECLTIDVGRRLNSQNVLAVLADLMIRRGVSDNERCSSEYSQKHSMWTMPSMHRLLPLHFSSHNHTDLQP